MSFSMIFKYFCILFTIFIITTKSIETSNLLRTQSDSSLQSSRSVDQNKGQPIQSQTLHSKQIYDTLVSIDERIRLLEAYDNTYKLTRIDINFEQLNQKTLSIESKFSRLETYLNSKLTKIEEMIVNTDRNEELITGSIYRKIEDLINKIDAKIQNELILDQRIEKIIERIDSIERYMHSSSEVLERMTKFEERHTVFESHVKSYIINIQNLVKHSLDANTNIKDIVSYDFEAVDKLVGALNDSKQHQNSVITRLTSITNQLQNSSSMNQRSSECLGEERYPNNESSGYTTNRNTIEKQTNVTNANTRDISNPKTITNNDIYENISSTLEQLRQLGVDERLTQLDVHIDYFSRKIINTIQEIWRSSQSSESYLREAIDMANKTRSFIRQEFQRLQQLINPLTKTADFSNIREPLEQKLYHLSSTIDDSFNALMISQNSFITSCNRIQEEEDQLYDILDDMIIEMRNKSSLDVIAVKESIEGLSVLLNQSMVTLETQIQTISKQLLNEIQNRIHLNDNKSSTSGPEECFLTKSELMSVCMRNENNININTNNENIEHKSEDNFEHNYEDLSQTV